MVEGRLARGLIALVAVLVILTMVWTAVRSP
jgi:hypothetical protein